MLHILFGAESDPGKCLIYCSRHLKLFASVILVQVNYQCGTIEDIFSHIPSGKDNIFINHRLNIRN